VVPTTPASSTSSVESLLTEVRLSPYRQVCAGDPAKVLPLYQWNAKTSVAAFEVVGHLEVLMRNAMDRELRRQFREDHAGIPWFMRPMEGGANIDDAVNATRIRLRGLQRETRDQIVAGLSFGFWTGLLGPKYDEVWKSSLHLAFPRSSGKRGTVASAVTGVRIFRNRLAHHDSLLRIDIPFEIERVLQIAEWIDADAAIWLRQLSNAMSVYAERPVKPLDTVVLPAAQAWNMYQQNFAYVCQPRRAFRPVERLAFYADKEVKPEVPFIEHRRDLVDWTPQSQALLAASGDRNDRKIATVIAASRDAGWTAGVYQVFLLSRPGASKHRTLPGPIAHTTSGRGSAFTQRQRYVSLHALEVAASTADL